MTVKQILITIIVLQFLGCEHKTNDTVKLMDANVVNNKKDNLNDGTCSSNVNEKELSKLDAQNSHRISAVISRMKENGLFEFCGVYKAYPYITDDGIGLMLLSKQSSKGGALSSYYGLHGPLRAYFNMEPVEIKCQCEIEGQETVEFMIDISDEGFREGFDHEEYDNFWKNIIIFIENNPRETTS